MDKESNTKNDKNTTKINGMNRLMSHHHNQKVMIDNVST